MFWTYIRNTQTQLKCTKPTSTIFGTQIMKIFILVICLFRTNCIFPSLAGLDRCNCSWFLPTEAYMWHCVLCKDFLRSVFWPCDYCILCFMALWHFKCHFRHGQLTYPHCSWTSLLGSLPVLSAHSFAGNWQLWILTFMSFVVAFLFWNAVCDIECSYLLPTWAACVNFIPLFSLY